jgi:hypothetical protein
MEQPRYVDTIEDFVEVFQKSGLQSHEQISSLVEEFEQRFVPAARYGRSLTSFLEFLIVRGVLTHWQAEKLRHGRWKGYLLDGYVLLDHMEVSETTSTYLAVESATGELIELTAKHPLSAQPDYEVRKFTGPR